MMRILCLHGTALNSKIFESRTETLRALLPRDYSYEWLDGPHQVTPPPLIRDTFTGPYLSHIESVTTEAVGNAISRLETILERDGPFDGIMGMSEGAMLAASLLFKIQLEQQNSFAPLRFGIFIAGMLPLTWKASVGDLVEVVSQKFVLLDTSDWETADVSSMTLSRDRFPALGLGGVDSKSGDTLPRVDVSSDPNDMTCRPRCLHPSMHSTRLDIPTLHVWGRHDALRMQSRLLSKLCNADLMESYQHDGGHDMPATVPETEMLAEMVQDLILRS